MASAPFLAASPSFPNSSLLAVATFFSAFSRSVWACVALQVIFEGSEESPGVEGLSLLPGRVVRFGGDGLKVPHIGWNELSLVRSHPVLDGLDGEAFYFVHSYLAVPEEGGDLIGETEYGVRFCSAAGRENLVAVQFHPEKSSGAGLGLYENFLLWAGA